MNAADDREAEERGTKSEERRTRASGRRRGYLLASRHRSSFLALCSSSSGRCGMATRDGERALVTGASKGIGAGIALALAREGADVAVNYHSDASGAEDVVKEIETLGRRAVALKANVGQVADCQQLVQQSAEALGGLHILVNNAGITLWEDFFDTDEAHWDATLDTNLKSVFFC